MRRLLFFWFVFLFLAPFSVSAQGAIGKPYAHYCPDPTQIFTGIQYETEYTPKIDLVVESSFEQRMQQERKLGALPVTPIYDLAIRVVPIINEYCLPQYDENGHLITKVDPPSTLPFTVYFALGNEILLGGTARRHALQKTEKGEPYYEWEKQGWPNGIFVSEKLERVIKAVQEKDPTLRIGVLVERPGKPPERVETPISFELCVPLSGGSPHKIVNMRGKSAGMNVRTLVQGAEQYRKEGFESIEPFKTYSREERSGGKGRYFAHFADLVPHDDTGWATLFGFFVGANKRPRAISSCGADGSQYFFHTGKTGGKKIFAYAPHGGGIAFLPSIGGGFVPAQIAMHEMGHSFGWLEDEYHSGFDVTLYYANCAPASPIINETEISRVVGSDKILRNRIQTGLRRAYWNPYGDTISGCHTKGQVRPSVKSIMNDGDFDSGQFNVVSCGYLLRSITGEENLRQHWKECMAMDGVEKPITTPSNIISLSSPFSSLFARIQGAVLAAVVAPSVTTDTRSGIDPSRFINLETFEADGSISAEIFERVGGDKGEQTTWRKVETEKDIDTALHTEDGASGGGLNWVERDGVWVMQLLDEEGKVFHEIPLPPLEELPVDNEITRSGLVENKAGAITLSVDGATDAVGVKKGEEAEVKWEGDETVVSCRGSWNPTEKLLTSGAAKVVVNESSTFTLSCLDADGAAITKSVIVSAVNPLSFFERVREFFAPSSSSGTAPPSHSGPGFDPPSSYPVRTLVLDTLGKSVQQYMDNFETDAKLQELIQGKVKKTWKVKYEKKGSFRFVCDPPVLNVSFDKLNSEGQKKKLFTAISTYPGRPQLEYQKIRMVPLCEAGAHYSGSSETGYGFGGKIDAHFREYAVQTVMRSLGVSATDVIGFADVSFVSPDPQYNGKTFQYMLLQRDNEQDDELPFTAQFNLDPALIEEGRDSINFSAANLLGTITASRNPSGQGAEKLSMRPDMEDALKVLLIASFFQDSDRLHNMDFARVKDTEQWKIIPYGFDFSLSSCGVESVYGSPRFWLKNYVEEKIASLPADEQKEYKFAYYRVARELLFDKTVLQKMHAVVNQFPLSTEQGKRLFHQYIDAAFYNLGSYFSSQEFANYTMVPHASLSPLPFATADAYNATRTDFEKECSVQPIRAESNATVEVLSSTLKTVLKKGAPSSSSMQDIIDYLQADFVVAIGAPKDKSVSISKQSAFLIQLTGPGEKTTLQFSFNNPNQYISYRKPVELPETVGMSWVIYPGMTARFSVLVRFSLVGDPITTHGDYTALIKSIESVGNVPLTPPTHRTNIVTLGAKGLLTATTTSNSVTTSTPFRQATTTVATSTSSVFGAFATSTATTTSPRIATTTASVSVLRVISPSAGELWNAGTLMTVAWRGDGLPPDAPIRVSLWRGRTASTAATNQLIQDITTPNDGSEVWVVPPTLAPGFYFIEIACASDAVFSCTSGASPAFRVVGSEPSAFMKADVKVNGSNKPPPMKPKSAFTLSWEVSGVGSCYPNFPTPGVGVIKSNGSAELVFDSAQPKIYELVCYNAEANRTKSDSIVITPIR